MLSFILLKKGKAMNRQESPEYSNHLKLLPQEHLIPIDIYFAILQKMKKELGLEAMIEYLEKYQIVIEMDNPLSNNAVTQALKMINIERIYHETASLV